MALATLQEVLEIAGRTNTAIPGFNIDNIEIPEAIMEAEEEENCPVILTIGQGAIHAGGLRHLPDVVRRIGESSSVPVVMHLDHGISYEQAVACLRAGFTSVMYDGSHHPFEENVRESRAVVRAAHAAGVSVECELGTISGVEDGMSHSGANLVDLEEVKRFLEAVDCDALAIGIGNAHGIYRGTPDLDFDRLAACRDLGAPPLVLHGGSGISKDMIQKAIRLGIRKINVATEVRLAFMEGLESAVGTRDIYPLGSNRDVQMEELKNDAVNPLPDVPNVGRVIRSISTFDKKTILQDFQTLANDIRQTGHNSYLYTHMLVSVVYGEITKLLVDINCPIENILENPLAAYQKILVCATLDDMLEELFQFVARICDFVNNHASANKSAAERAKVYIETHYADSSLTLDRVAGAVGISPNYFSSLFKQSTNCSFISYLTIVRIAHAKELLKSGTYKTYEVAMRCGYENPTYFSTIFKRQTGFSPSEYSQKA